jgi:aspartyl-tRNA(Asn)/glutamyl-tRNA(Gln) amidotransferase subunit A
VPLSATELIAAYERRELSPVEVVDDCVRLIESQDTNAFTTLTLDTAREQARQAEQAYAQGTARPLEGIPTGVKDLFDTAGVRTTYGSKIFADHVPTADAAVVTRIKDAGAVIMGKTTTHEFAWGLSGVNPHFGTPRNPKHPGRVPGGSSCGSAAALAAGEIALALGTDTGGSIRVPSTFCGTVGIKPTHGAVSLEGCFALAPSLDHAGPMARTIDDLVLLYEILVGRPLPPPEAPEQAEPGDMVDMRDVFRPIQLAEAIGVHRRAGLWPSRRDDYGSDVAARLRLAEAVTLDELVEASAERERIRAAWKAANGDRLIITPVSDGPPPALEDDQERSRELVLRHTATQDVLGLPSCAVAGVQVTGPRGSEARVLAAARALH